MFTLPLVAIPPNVILQFVEPVLFLHVPFKAIPTQFSRLPVFAKVKVLFWIKIPLVTVKLPFTVISPDVFGIVKVSVGFVLLITILLKLVMVELKFCVWLPIKVIVWPAA